METVILFVDDIRKSPHRVGSVTARSYNEAINWMMDLHFMHYEVIIDLDHDLGEKYSGYDICKWIVEQHYPLKGFMIHSMNPVGVNNMRQLLTHYGYKEHFSNTLSL